MIVTMNSMNSDKYLNLFTESYEYLKGLDNGYVDINKDRFSSLAEYYSHMADFFENQKYKYVMLPLDEDPFVIDLNTRAILVPTSFSKCASVQADQLAETIIFITERYFDYMDLANTEIYVQWTIPENKKLGIKEYNGATRVEMVDLESEPGKIKFAWPLNDTVTAHPGNVKFSVRFFRIDNASPNKLLYSLNTLESSIIIKEALQPNLNATSDVESPVSDNSFKKAILNSLFPNEGVNPPVQPVFFEPGSNINADTMFKYENMNIVSLQDDTITLKVQAIVADAGDITYKWYHTDAEGNSYDCEENGFGIVKDAFVEVEPEVRAKNERYYEADGSGYKLYTGDIPAIGTTLYERYSTFTVPSEGAVTGKYQAAAWNNIKLTDGRTLTTVHPSYSENCLLPGPTTIIFKENGNLPYTAILKSQNEDEENLTALLQVQIEKDRYQPEISYEWRRSQISAEDTLNEDNLIPADKNSCIASQPGWYSVKVTAKLNREEKYQFSNVCKVTNSPNPPVVETQDLSTTAKRITSDSPAEFTINATIANPDGLNDLLLSDNITYIWQIQYVDNPDKYFVIQDNLEGVNGQGTNTLTVDKKFKHPVANFRCLVINNLNGEKAIFDHSGTYETDNLTGMFKKEPPFIYEDAKLNYIFTAINNQSI